MQYLVAFFLCASFAAFPGLRKLWPAEDGKVAFLTTGTGTNTGKLGEVGPTGKSVKIQNLIVHRINENNQIAETWVLWDNVAFLKQLGIYPPKTE